MPLIKSKSKNAFSSNVSAEMNAGKPQKQALAIAYSIARKAARGGGLRINGKIPPPSIGGVISKKPWKGYKKGGAIKKEDGGELSPEDQAAMMPETYVNPLANHLVRQSATAIPNIIKNFVEGAQEYQPGDPSTAGKITDASGALVMQGLTNALPVRAPIKSATMGAAGPLSSKFLKEARETRDRLNKDFSRIGKEYKKDLQLKSMAEKEYTEPSYRGISSHYSGEGPSPVHDFEKWDPYIYSTPNPMLADMYTSYLDHHPGYHVPEGTFTEGANVMPLKLDTRDYHYFNAEGKPYTQANYRAIQEAKEKGKKGVIVDNVWDEPSNTRVLGSPNKVYITFPEGAGTVKSRFAKKFDPSSPNILHSTSGIGMGNAGTGYITMAHPEEPQEKKYGGKAMAAGGIPNPPWFVRNEARGSSGMLKSAIPGRTDKIPLNVPGGSYVLPADIPSALGQGNTMAGGTILEKIFNRGPYGMNLPRSHGGSGPPRMGRLSSLTKVRKSSYADGGDTGTAKIIAAGGEFIIHPDQVRMIGGGDIDKGHAVLDAFVKHVRKQHIATLKSLPGPKKN